MENKRCNFEKKQKQFFEWLKTIENDERTKCRKKTNTPSLKIEICGTAIEKKKLKETKT